MIGLACLLLFYLGVQAYRSGSIALSCAGILSTAHLRIIESRQKIYLLGFLMQTKIGPWEWFTEKVLPSLFLAVALSVAATSFAIWQSVAELTSTVKYHKERLDKLEVAQQQLVTRTELLETLKRVEQQLQIVLLQSGVKQRIELK
jgi:hypothetical protein